MERSDPAGRSRIRAAYVPPQHGAWAFLGLPLALGATVTSVTPLLLVLAVAWVSAYPLSYAALGLIRAKRPERFRLPLVVWSLVCLPAVAVLLVTRPWLAWVGLAYLALFAINLRYARRNDERAIANDLVFIAECSAMVVVTWAVGAGAQSWGTPAVASVPRHAWILALVCALVLAGSTLHVKSLIRERADPRSARLSRTVAVGSVVVSAGLAAWWGLPSGLWLIAPFVLLLVRSVLVGARRLKPGVIGMIELACFAAVAICSTLASL